MLTDLLIIKKIKEGDVHAFEAVFRQYYTPLCLYASGIVQQPDVAEELIQDLFYYVWKERTQLHIFHSLKSYLYGAAKNRALQYCERQAIEKRYREKLQAAPDSVELDPQSEFELKELEQLLQSTLTNLPERRRMIFLMHRKEQMKYSEIASKLAISVKTVEAEISKTLCLFRKELEKYYETNNG